MKASLVIVIAVLVAAFAVLGLVYAFGVPQQTGVAESASPVAPQFLDEQGRPDRNAPRPPGDPALEADRAKVPSDAVAPPPDLSVPLAIEIPGCVCHSKDPKLVKQHAAYRMNQCAGCHVGGAPTGQ